MTDNVERRAVELKQCPFCGGEPEVVRRGNNLSHKRFVEINCPKCKVKRVTGAIRQSFEWCENTAEKLWNARALPDSGEVERLRMAVRVAGKHYDECCYWNSGHYGCDCKAGDESLRQALAGPKS